MHAWQIESTFLGYEHNPFTGKPFFNEVVFLHKLSGCVMTTDLFWNYPSEGVPLGTKLWKFGMDVVYKPFYLTLMICDSEGFQEAADKMLKQWEWVAVLPCHGRFVPAGGKELLSRHLRL